MQCKAGSALMVPCGCLSAGAAAGTGLSEVSLHLLYVQTSYGVGKLHTCRQTVQEVAMHGRAAPALAAAVALGADAAAAAAAMGLEPGQAAGAPPLLLLLLLPCYERACFVSFCRWWCSCAVVWLWVWVMPHAARTAQQALPAPSLHTHLQAASRVWCTWWTARWWVTRRARCCACAPGAAARAWSSGARSSRCVRRARNLPTAAGSAR